VFLLPDLGSAIQDLLLLLIDLLQYQHQLFTALQQRNNKKESIATYGTTA
jgi:hypothetical protein